jgi:hypothetical protein
MGVSAEGAVVGQSLWVILNSWRGRRVDMLIVVYVLPVNLRGPGWAEVRMWLVLL